MKKVNSTFLLGFALSFMSSGIFSQEVRTKLKESLVMNFRLNYPEKNSVEYIDLDKDGDPDVLKAVIVGGMPVLWIDDDDDMKVGDMEGDMDSDCLLIDKNKDGKYAAGKDIVIDWNDEDGDNNPDMQIVVDNSHIDDKGRWFGHYMCTIDSDNDNVFNHIDWRDYAIEAWDHSRRCNFFQDYHGNTVLLKAHTSTFNIDDLRYSWENPFLFYDPDNDGQTEMSIRFADNPKVDYIAPDSIKKYPELIHSRNFKYQHVIEDARIAIDLDNDNDQDNELDFDFGLRFTGEGFNYEDQVNVFKSMKGLPGTDTFFYDPRWRQLDQLIYTKPENAFSSIFNKGKWSTCYFVYDEDDDCQRWERVEFYEPRSPFRIGTTNDGLDSHPQADAAGDRGEWDMDNSGKGKLYISVCDGRLHLYGAEWGAWRIDENTFYYQGWQGWRGLNPQPEDFVQEEPEKFVTVRYVDTDSNGFLNMFEFDLDGDQDFEYSIDIKRIGLIDSSEIIDISEYEYADFVKLQTRIADGLWQNAQSALKEAQKLNLNVNWYANLMHPKSIREKYDHGYWLNFHLYLDFLKYGKLKRDQEFVDKVTKAYFSMNWNLLSK